MLLPLGMTVGVGACLGSPSVLHEAERSRALLHARTYCHPDANSPLSPFAPRLCCHAHASDRPAGQPTSRCFTGSSRPCGARISTANGGQVAMAAAPAKRTPLSHAGLCAAFCRLQPAAAPGAVQRVWHHRHLLLAQGLGPQGAGLLASSYMQTHPGALLPGVPCVCRSCVLARLRACVRACARVHACARACTCAAAVRGRRTQLASWACARAGCRDGGPLHGADVGAVMAWGVG